MDFNELLLFLLLAFGLIGIFYGIVLVIAIFKSKKYLREYPNSKPMVWWFFLGYSTLATCAFPLILGPFGEEGGLTGLLINSVYYLAVSITAWYMVYHTSRVSALTLTIISLNPILWIINGFYLNAKWETLKKNHPTENFTRNLLLSVIGMSLITGVWVTYKMKTTPDRRKILEEMIQKNAQLKSPNQVTIANTTIQISPPATWEALPTDPQYSEIFKFQTEAGETVTVTHVPEIGIIESLIKSHLEAIANVDPRLNVLPPEQSQMNGLNWAHLAIPYTQENQQVFEIFNICETDEITIIVSITSPEHRSQTIQRNLLAFLPTLSAQRE